jgi:cytochrome c2
MSTARLNATFALAAAAVLGFGLAQAGLATTRAKTTTTTGSKTITSMTTTSKTTTSKSTTTTTPAKTTTTTSTSTTPSPTAMLAGVSAGRRLFVAQACGACHIMAAANQMDGSGVGPDLDHVTWSYPQIVTQITNGGHGMSAYKGALASAQIDALADFIYTTSHPA